MHLHRRQFVVIKAGALHFARIERKTQRLDQMQIGAGVGAEADDIARVRREFRLVQKNNSKALLNQSLYLEGTMP